MSGYVRQRPAEGVFARRGRRPPIGHIVQLWTAMLVKVLTLGARRDLLLLVILLSTRARRGRGRSTVLPEQVRHQVRQVSAVSAVALLRCCCG